MDKELSITIRLRDETEKALKSAHENISQFEGTVKKAFGDISANIKAGGVAAAGFLTTVGILGKSMIELGSNMEQTRIAFTTMLGSADLAGQKIKELSDFAVKTPFDLPQVYEGAKRLLAYNIEADKLIPTFKMLGDIAAGVGTDKLPQVILAFGQVKAATKLTGAELRQFSEAGVPLLEALVNKANESGGVLTKIGGLSEKAAKQVGSLSAKLVDQEYRFKLLTDAGQTHSVSYKMLEKHIGDAKQKLTEFGSAGEASYLRVKATAKDMIEQTSDGTVKFEDVQQSLLAMTQEGGKFFNLMEAQAKTFGGVMSNIRDTYVRFALEVLGFTQEGEIRKGSVFFYLKIGAEQMLQALNTIKPVAVQFFDTLLQNKHAVMAIAGAFAGLALVATLAFVLIAGQAILVATAFAVVGAAIAYLISYWDDLKIVIQNVIAYFITIPATIGTIITGIIQWFQQLPDRAGQFIRDLFANQIPYWIGYAIGYVSVAIPQMVKDVENWFWQMVFIVTATMIQIYNWITTKFTQAWDWISTNVPTWPEKIYNFIKSIPSLVSQVFHDAKEGAINKMNELWKGVSDIWEKIKGIFESLKKLAEEAWSAAQKGFDAGKQTAGRHYASGGWVNYTGPATVHAGEYVLSRDMLAGRQQVDSRVSNTNNSRNVTVNAIINNPLDFDSVLDKLNWKLNYSY